MMQTLISFWHVVSCMTEKIFDANCLKYSQGWRKHLIWRKKVFYNVWCSGHSTLKQKRVWLLPPNILFFLAQIFSIKSPRTGALCQCHYLAGNKSHRLLQYFSFPWKCLKGVNGLGWGVIKYNCLIWNGLWWPRRTICILPIEIQLKLCPVHGLFSPTGCNWEFSFSNKLGNCSWKARVSYCFHNLQNMSKAGAPLKQRNTNRLSTCKNISDILNLSVFSYKIKKKSMNILLKIQTIMHYLAKKKK